MNLKEPAGRLAHWIVELQGYNFPIIRRRDISFRVPTALTESSDLVALSLSEDKEINFAKTEDSWYLQRKAEVAKFPKRNPDWRIEHDLLYHHRPNPLVDELMPDLNA